MRKEKLVGLAAPQLGVSNTVFVTEIPEGNSRGVAPDELRVFVNPKIITASSLDIENEYEGCGSLAEGNLFALVPRPKHITVEAYNVQGEKFTLEASGLLARIIQHEYDHLYGVLFLERVVDHSSWLTKEMYVEMRRQQAEQKTA